LDFQIFSQLFVLFSKKPSSTFARGVSNDRPFAILSFTESRTQCFGSFRIYQVSLLFNDDGKGFDSSNRSTEAATDSFNAVSAKLKTMNSINNTATTVQHQAENGKNEFIHRVKILNLPPHEINSTKRLLQNHGIFKFKKAPKWEYAFLNYEVSDTVSWT